MAIVSNCNISRNHFGNAVPLTVFGINKNFINYSLKAIAKIRSEFALGSSAVNS